MHLEIEKKQQDDDLILILRGDIDEYAQFTDIELKASTRLVMDLAGVKLINSLGVRNWIRWIRSIKGQIFFKFQRCPRVLVEQMNILDGFMPLEATVDSFYIPYECEACGREENVLAVRGKDYVEGTADNKMGILIPEHRECPHCHNDMEWGVIPEKYFRFLRYRR